MSLHRLVFILVITLFLVGCVSTGGLRDTATDNYEELTKVAKDRIFNLGYYTWVEQQGVELKDFNARKDQEFWKDMKKYIPIWDKMIEEFNEKAK